MSKLPATNIFGTAAAIMAVFVTVIPAMADEATVVVTLARQQIWQGPIPYVGTFGVGINGTLQKVENQSGFTLSFPKFGRSTAECGNPNSVVVIGSRQSTSRENLQAIYNTPTPRLPLTFIACVAAASLPAPDYMLLAITFYVATIVKPF